LIAGLAGGAAGAGTGLGAAIAVAKGLAWLLAAEGAGAPHGAAVTAGAGGGGTDQATRRGADNRGTRGDADADADADGAGQGDVDSPPNRVCLDGLRARQVAFVEWPTKGVRTPVRILGPLGAVALRSHDSRSTSKTVLMDCELARALIDAAPAFQALGVRELLYSGAYQYRTRRRSTRLSEHAHGLAIDVHAFVIDPGPRAAAGSLLFSATPLADVDLAAAVPDGGAAGEGAAAAGTRADGVAGAAAPAAQSRTVVAEVTRDFEPRVGKWAVTAQDECIGRPRTATGRALRTLACRLRASSIFREVIIPDDNADHHDHFHLEAFPDALSRTRAVLARKPSVTDD